MFEPKIFHISAKLIYQSIPIPIYRSIDVWNADVHYYQHQNKSDSGILVIYIVLFLNENNSENEILLTMCNNAQLCCCETFFKTAPIFFKNTMKSSFQNCPLHVVLKLLVIY